MNRIFIVGNITGNIHFNTVNRDGRERPFLRILLMSSRPRIVKGLRVIMWDDMATMYFPYLTKGSELGVIGHLVTRDYEDKIIIEVEAKHLILLRNINWNGTDEANGRAALLKPRANSVFVVGTVGEDIHFEWRTKGGEENHQYAYMRILLNNAGAEETVKDLRVVTIGNLAQLAFPYLRSGSVIAVDGHIQTRDRSSSQKVVEIIAEHMVFLENIDWEAGTAAQKRMQED
jgi:single-stranded DNA-binding protein